MLRQRAALELLRDVRGRVATIVCELDLGEVTVAYQVATDLEHDLDAAMEERRAA
jgi:hypothetical protein